jgi:hypothetical protein
MSATTLFPDVHHLEVGWLTQYKYAWCEPTDLDGPLADCDRCETCGRALSLLKWLPPYRVNLKQPRVIAEFSRGVFDFVVTDIVREGIEREGFTGVAEFHPLEVVRMGAHHKPGKYAVPKLFGVSVQRTQTRLDYGRSVESWRQRPAPDHCRACGPGGGGEGGVVEKFRGFFFESDTLVDADFFLPKNLNGSVFVSGRVVNWLREIRARNVDTALAHVYRPPEPTF